MPPAVVTFAQTAQSQHKDHAAAWNGVLTGAGKKAVTGVDLTVKKSVDQAFAKVKDVPGLAKLALDLENVAAATYLAAIDVVKNPAGIKTAASIQPVELQHAAILNFLLGQYPVPDAFAQEHRRATGERQDRLTAASSPSTRSCVRVTSVASGRSDCTDEEATMKYRAFGRTGVQVSRLCLGAMMFGAWGNPDHDESIAVIHAALDAGINFIDTADVYSAGESEEIVAKALQGRRDDVVLATKFFAPMGADLNMSGGSRRWIIRECENSLRRLQTDYIDLYQVHRPDPNVDIDETLGALTDLVHQGKVRYLGSSTYPASAIVEAQWVAERRHRERFVCEQPPYSILVRGVEADVLPTCERHGMAVIPWSPLAGGWLSGKWRKGGDDVHQPPRQPHPGALRPRRSRQPAEARCRRRARAARRRRRASRWCTSRWRGCCATPRSRRRSSGRARWSSSPPSSARPTSSSTTTCSTASTRSCRPARTSPGPTPGTRRR